MSKHGDIYREIPMTLWDREDFRDLSANAKAIVLYLFMLTGPLSIRVPGIFRAGKATIAEGLRWPLKMFEEALVELETRKMVIADWHAPLVWMPGELNGFNKPKNPSHATGWRNALRLLPDCDLKVRATEAIETFLMLHGYPTPSRDGADTVSTPSRHSTATASVSVSNPENGSKPYTSSHAWRIGLSQREIAEKDKVARGCNYKDHQDYLDSVLRGGGHQAT